MGFSGTLGVDESVTFESTGTVAAGEYRNTVEVNGTAHDTTVTATDEWFGYGDVPAPTPGSAAPVPSGPGGKLPTTGGDLPVWLIGLGVALVAVGVGATAYRARRGGHA